MTDDELTDAWEAGHVFAGGISHVDHVRIGWVLHRRHGEDEARLRLVHGTRRACELHGCPEKFDAVVTERWSNAIAEAVGRDGFGPTAGAFVEAHPELLDGRRFGPARP